MNPPPSEIANARPSIVLPIPMGPLNKIAYFGVINHSRSYARADESQQRVIGVAFVVLHGRGLPQPDTRASG
jgi:hypothetical protein